MITFTVVPGVTCTTTKEIYNRFCQEKMAAQAKAKLEEWLANPANVNDEQYSDIFKEIYGVRPPR